MSCNRSENNDLNCYTASIRGIQLFLYDGLLGVGCFNQAKSALFTERSYAGCSYIKQGCQAICTHVTVEFGMLSQGGVGLNIFFICGGGADANSKNETPSTSDTVAFLTLVSHLLRPMYSAAVDGIPAVALQLVTTECLQRRADIQDSSLSQRHVINRFKHFPE